MTTIEGEYDMPGVSGDDVAAARHFGITALAVAHLVEELNTVAQDLQMVANQILMGDTADMPADSQDIEEAARGLRKVIKGIERELSQLDMTFVSPLPH